MRVTWRSFQAGALRVFLPSFATFPLWHRLTALAGTSQMVALDIRAHPLPLFALAVSVFVANPPSSAATAAISAGSWGAALPWC